jgi:UDP-N-acetylglucosamine diphosphorylase/glucosamine-1-phosphate N-acetyltransferase
MAGEFVGWIVPEGEPLPGTAMLLEPEAAGAAVLELPGSVLPWPWDLVRRNPDRIASDVREGRASRLELDPGVHLLGDHGVFGSPEARIEPGVIVDTREGPIHVAEGVRVQGPARLVGPLHLGRDTQVLGGTVARTSAGPTCKLRGEVDGSVVLGFSNKAHDGYLGHALVGRWVNLGAFTTNSDLKNNYAPVRVPTDATSRTDTGLLKVGCFLGDHVKTGIGTLLTTGSVVGAGSNLFGGRMPPAWVPPFSWGAGTELGEYRFDAFLAVARAAMSRRGMELDAESESLLGAAWRRTRSERVGPDPTE